MQQRKTSAQFKEIFMKICVINGSPKGQYSITLQTLLYIQKHTKKHDWQFIHAGQKIKYYENHLDKIIDAINEAHLVIFSYPVYTFMAPYQLHRLIEMLKERNISFNGKFATQISTSKHFYDVTAHQYIHENGLDLGFTMIAGLSADMDDLTKTQGQRDAMLFWNSICHFMKENKRHQPKDISKKIAIVTNVSDDDKELQQMITSFQFQIGCSSTVYNIAKYPLKGGCISCFRCATDGECIYKDGFSDLLRNQINRSDAIVYAFRIKDHSMGASFKQYDDRQFCNGHRTVNMGMPVGYLITGDLSKETNLKMVIEGRAQVGHNYLAGIASCTNEILPLCQNLAYALDHHFILPQNFLGVGGMKIFRDLIYVMGGMMKADYQFYKEKGFFKDMPHKQIKNIIMMHMVGALLSNKELVKKMGNKMNEAMIAPYKKIINSK